MHNTDYSVALRTRSPNGKTHPPASLQRYFLYRTIYKGETNFEFAARLADRVR